MGPGGAGGSGGAGRSVSDEGEHALIELIARTIGRERTGKAGGEVWAGDDAAVIESPSERLVYTIDTLVEGVDFDLSYCTGADVGWKAVASGVSDVAAMGGSSSHAVTSLSLPGRARASLVEDILDGLVAASARWDVSMVGGDLGSASEVVLTVAVLGAVSEHGAVLRSTARPGDALCVTGTLGGAAGGLGSLREGGAGPVSVAELGLRMRQLRPEARADAGRALAPFATAMIDVSDGLAVDCWRLLEASDAGAEIDPKALPVDPQLEAAGVEDPLQLAIIGGEDFELLAAIAPSDLAPAMAATDVALTRIGTVTDGPRRLGEDDLDHWRRRGWEHLRDR